VSFIAEAKSRHSLAEVALRTGIPVPQGATHSITVRCPFPAHGHPDHSPSLRLYLADNYYCCLGCGSKGDVIQWTREAEQMTVTAAIQKLDAGGPLTNAWAGQTPAQLIHHRVGAAGEVPRLDRTEREVVLAALDAAWDFYSSPSLHRRGVAYLASRGIDVSVVEAHNGQSEVGHTSSSDGLVSALLAKGFNDDELVDAALATRRSEPGRLSDFYLQRVLIPVRDEYGAICGLIGRNVGDPRYPKYKNPPHTLAYDKSVNLYQPLLAPSDAGGRVVVVEGTLDTMAVAAAAIRTGHADRYCPVTQSGRELSDAQLTYVLGLHPNSPVISFDGDAAGQNSNIRVSRAAAERGDKVLVTVLPADHDPASWLAEHGDDGLEALALGHCVEGDGATDESGPKRGDRSNRYAPLPVGMATSLLVDDGVLTGVIL
jgi:DNA primase